MKMTKKMENKISAELAISVFIIFLLLLGILYQGLIIDQLKNELDACDKPVIYKAEVNPCGAKTICKGDCTTIEVCDENMNCTFIPACKGNCR